MQYSGNKDSDETTKVKHLALTQFAVMAQGDTRTQTIRLQNRSFALCGLLLAQIFDRANVIIEVEFRMKVGWRENPYADSGYAW